MNNSHRNTKDRSNQDFEQYSKAKEMNQHLFGFLVTRLLLTDCSERGHAMQKGGRIYSKMKARPKDNRPLSDV